MVKTLQSHIKQLQKFNKDRIIWLRLSGFVVIMILLMVVDWQLINEYQLNKIVVVGGLIISAIWWYWTMKLIREILSHKITELDILSSIVDDIKEIKKDIKNLDQSS